MKRTEISTTPGRIALLVLRASTTTTPRLHMRSAPRLQSVTDTLVSSIVSSARLKSRAGPYDAGSRYDTRILFCLFIYLDFLVLACTIA